MLVSILLAAILLAAILLAASPLVHPASRAQADSVSTVGSILDPSTVYDRNQPIEGHEVTTSSVSLAYFRATREGALTRLEWSTTTEVGNLGFWLYVETAHGRQRINAELVLSWAVDSLERLDYAYEAMGLRDELFWLEDVDVRGQVELHGPFKLGEVYGLRADAETVDWEAVLAEHERKVEQRRDEQTVQPRPVEAMPPAESSYRPLVPMDGHTVMLPLVGRGWGETPPPVSLSVNRTGLYRVTYEQLNSQGLSYAGVQADQIALTNRGESVPIYVHAAGGTFGPGGYIELYGEALDTLYTDTNVYTLLADEGLAERVATDATPPAGAAAPFYGETELVDRNNAYFYTAPGDDPWFDAKLQVATTPLNEERTLNVDHYLADAAPATLMVDLWGVTAWPTVNPDHHVKLTFNGQVVAEEWFDGIERRIIQVTLPAGLLHEGANTLVINLPADTGVAAELIYLNSYAVTYPRAFAARDGGLTFTATGAAFQVEGLPSSEVVVYRLQGEAVTRLSGLQVAGAPGAHSVTFAGDAVEATYAVASAEAIMTPDMRPAPTADITAGTAQYLVISHPDFVAGLEPLAAARRSQGWDVRIVDVEAVYPAFGYGIFDPQAIRSYIAYAASHMATEYVLLVGADTYDYRGYMQPRSISFIPTFYVQTSAQVRFTPADPLLADIDGDEVPDLPIGRLPVRTAADLDVVIAKTLSYDVKTYLQSGFFTADNANENEVQGMYADQSDAMIAQLPVGWAVQTAYLDEMLVADARAAMLAAINDGVTLTSYVGHSSLDRLAFESLLHLSHVPLLTNLERPTLMALFGCWNTYYVQPTSDSLGQKLILSTAGGAAAVMGSTLLGETNIEAALGLALMPRLAQPNQPIGLAIQQARAEMVAAEPWLARPLLGWTLLGDPTLTLDP
ncbi:MAG: hypothetical protein JXA74_09030 [Anaerolineae bacterium]|nr:hypothetical protein [Anaerolineae bacterium]